MPIDDGSLHVSMCQPGLTAAFSQVQRELCGRVSVRCDLIGEMTAEWLHLPPPYLPGVGPLCGAELEAWYEDLQDILGSDTGGAKLARAPTCTEVSCLKNELTLTHTTNDGSVFRKCLFPVGGGRWNFMLGNLYI